MRRGALRRPTIRRGGDRLGGSRAGRFRAVLSQLFDVPRRPGPVSRGSVRRAVLARPRVRAQAAGAPGGDRGGARVSPDGVVGARLERVGHRVLPPGWRAAAGRLAHLPPHRGRAARGCRGQAEPGRPGAGNGGSGSPTRPTSPTHQPDQPYQIATRPTCPVLWSNDAVQFRRVRRRRVRCATD